jgi:hypothetical protein
LWENGSVYPDFRYWGWDKKFSLRFYWDFDELDGKGCHYIRALAQFVLSADGKDWTSKGLGGVLATPAIDPINIGCQRASAGNGATGQYFTGYLNSVRIWGGVLTPAQVAANYSLGPWILAPTNGGISFAAISNVTLNADVTLKVANSASDPNVPPLPLTFAILAGPTNASIITTNGVFTWRPAIAQAGTTNVITLMVQIMPPPSLGATQSFVVTVNPAVIPGISAALMTNGVFSLQITGAAGPDYVIQTSTNLVDWTGIFTSTPSILPFAWGDTNAVVQPQQFYKVSIRP